MAKRVPTVRRAARRGGAELPAAATVRADDAEQVERARLEDALLDSEASLRAVFENSLHSFMLIGIDRRIRYYNRGANESAVAVLGRELRKGEPIDDFVLPGDRESFDANFARALGGEARRVEKSFATASGARHFDFRYSPVRTDGDVTGVFFDVSDVTDRKRAEEALARSADFNERVFNSTDVHLAVVGPDGVIQRVNEAWRRFGGDNGERDQRVCGVGATYFVPVDERWGDTALAREAYEGIRSVQRGEQAEFSLEYPCHAPRGETRWFMMRVRPLLGMEGTVLVAHTDVSSIRRAEARLRETDELFSQFLRHSPVYAYVKEVDEGASRVLRASDNFGQMTGIPGPDMVGKTMAELFPPELAEAMSADDWKVVSDRQVVRVEETLGGRAYSSIKFPLVLGDKTLLAGYTIDVTEQLRAEEERRALERKVRLAEKAASLGTMAGGIAHQFNNLFTAIVGNLELARAAATPAVDELLADAESAARRASTIGKSMLSYLGQGARRREARSLGSSLGDVLAPLRAALPADVRLELDVADDVPWTTIDPADLRTLVSNLVENAIEAVGAEGGAVRVSARRREALATDDDAEGAPTSHAGPWACLEIHDDGAGMPQEIRERAFDPYFSTKFPGRGLGLPVTLGIVRASGGVIRLESAPRRGTTVRVYLPASTAAELAAASPPTPREPAPVATRAPGSGAVLLVDDDAVVLRASRRMLERLGHRVIAVSSGAEAWALFSAGAERIGSVLLDLSMPNMDGWEVLAALRRLRPDAYVVVVSGYDLAEIKQERREVVPDGWLQKPFQANALAALLPGRGAPAP